MRLNKHPGFVWEVDGDEIVIHLRTGGRIRCQNKGFKLGDRVAVIPDICRKEIVNVFPLAEANESVKRGSDPMYEAACFEPEPLLTEEELIHGDDPESSDDTYGNPWCDIQCD